MLKIDKQLGSHSITNKILVKSQFVVEMNTSRSGHEWFRWFRITRNTIIAYDVRILFDWK